MVRAVIWAPGRGSGRGGVAAAAVVVHVSERVPLQRHICTADPSALSLRTIPQRVEVFVLCGRWALFIAAR